MYDEVTGARAYERALPVSSLLDFIAGRAQGGKRKVDSISYNEALMKERLHVS